MIESYALKDLKIYKPLVSDYLNQSEVVSKYVSSYPSLESIDSMIETKFLSSNNRKILSEAFLEMYEGLEMNSSVKENIHLLRDSRTFTVTTGHQLNLFSGPLYFLIKIAQTISLAKDLKKKLPGYNFIPVYWMATEDHDLEEIDHFNLFRQKRQWVTNQKGATGRMNTVGISELGKEIAQLFERNEEVKSLVENLSGIYNSANSLAEATRRMVHFLFPNDPLLILDADHHSLKSLFKGHLKQELLDNSVQKHLTKTNDLLSKEEYHHQLNPREINIFYIEENKRARIEKVGNSWSTVDGEKRWSETELLDELDEFPERFSPNAALRPVYQEYILPNLVNVGGPGEVAYWLQLKAVFDEFKVDFPFLFMRNSHSFISLKQQSVLKEFGLEFNDLLKRKEDLIKQASGELLEVSFDKESSKMNELFDEILRKTIEIDKGLEGRVHGMQKGWEKELNSLESKLEKSVRAKNDQKFKQLEKLSDAIYPSEGLNERSMNFLNLLNSMSLEDFMSRIKQSDADFVPKLFVHVI